MIMMPWGRVGSNLLFSNIAQVVREHKVRFANENLIKIKGGEQQIEWMRQFYDEVNGIEVFGSKQNIESVRCPGDMGDVLTEMGIQLIRMRRSNIVKVAISQLRAELYAERTLAQTGAPAWGVRREHEPLEPVPLKAQRFLRVAARARKADDLLAGFAPAVATYDIEYRDIQRNLDGVTARVCAWLGLDVDQKVESNYVKATSDDLAVAVPNLDELRSALRASSLADLDAMFDD